MRDAYNDCVTAASGKNPSSVRTPDAMIRIAERDARRLGELKFLFRKSALLIAV